MQWHMHIGVLVDIMNRVFSISIFEKIRSLGMSIGICVEYAGNSQYSQDWMRSCASLQIISSQVKIWTS